MPDEAKKRILIIDDDGFLADIYATKLELEGYEVTKALDGQAGLEAAIANPPDAIMLDVIMPRMDGFETLAQLKKNDATKGIPVLMLTSMGQKEDIDHGMSLGAVDYLIKSQNLPTDAVEKIRTTLAK